MQHSHDSIRAAALLTNRLVRLDVKPLAAREFWRLVEQVDPGDLLHATVAEIGERAAVGPDEAARLRALLDAATALGFEEERLREGGISLVSAFDPAFPARLREVLGTACPPFLTVAGRVEWLARPGLGVVGSRDAEEPLLAVAAGAARCAVAAGWSVVSGLARGVDQTAMDAGYGAGGMVVGVPAEGIARVARSADLRRRVHAGQLCLASPFAPDAPFRAGNAMGRNKIVYALAQVTFVVRADEGSGGTWGGATEALDHGHGTVAVWTGDAAPAGNTALARRGATAVRDLADLLHAEPTERPSQGALF